MRCAHFNCSHNQQEVQQCADQWAGARAVSSPGGDDVPTVVAQHGWGVIVLSRGDWETATPRTVGTGCSSFTEPCDGPTRWLGSGVWCVGTGRMGGSFGWWCISRNERLHRCRCGKAFRVAQIYHLLLLIPVPRSAAFFGLSR